MEDPSQVESTREDTKQAEETTELESKYHCISEKSEEFYSKTQHEQISSRSESPIKNPNA